MHVIASNKMSILQLPFKDTAVTEASLSPQTECIFVSFQGSGSLVFFNRELKRVYQFAVSDSVRSTYIQVDLHVWHAQKKANAYPGAS